MTTDTIQPVSRNDAGHLYTGTTLTAGQLIAYLAQFPADMPITAMGPDGGDYLNLEGASNPYEYDEPSVILYTASDYDSRQW